ncbi:6829_t:CDS:10 [Acaulospora colombiana]|uniref:6829_t:CDS:1 n=1 Tax=Acaulospora colombiana TaxID=27376 RepID=A0ACA9KLQ7_9GLOM|nr:6829_t:CDS:10 [Acaulospora colombiana]
MIQTAELSNIPSESNSILLLDAYYRYASSGEMKIESSLFPSCTNSRDHRGTTSSACPASTIPDYVSRQKSTLDTSAFSRNSMIPSTKTFDLPNYRPTSPNGKVTPTNDYGSFSTFSREFEKAGDEKSGVTTLTNTNGYASGICGLYRFPENNPSARAPSTETFSHCQNRVSRGRHQSITSDVTLVEQFDTGDVNLHRDDEEEIREDGISRSSLSGPSILLFEENPVLKLALNSRDPMVKYLSKALIEVIDQAFENDNTWTLRRIEWIETIKLVKKELEKHKKDKTTLKQQIKSLALAYDIIKKEVEKIRQENFIIQKELMEAREKILTLEREKIRNQGEMMWNSIKTVFGGIRTIITSAANRVITSNRRLIDKTNECIIGQEINANHLLKLKAAKNFYENLQPITSADFDDSGELCVTASADDSINLYNCLQGRLFYGSSMCKSVLFNYNIHEASDIVQHKKLLWSKKYGIHITRFTHLNTNILYASTKENDSLRYLSLHMNKFIRYFEGHQNRVVSLELSPSNDLFLSGSVNEGVRLWDLRQFNEIGFINNQTGRPCVAFDPTGVVFAICFQNLDSSIRLYDIRKFDKAPFATFNVVDNYITPSVYPRIPVFPEWTGLKFSSDGEKILLTTSGDVHYIVDAYDGELKRRLVGHVGLNNASAFLGGEETCFTPDGRYVIAGSQDGQINFWDTATTLSTSNMLLEGIDTRSMHTLEHHVRPTQVVKFNPTRLMMISACTDLAFWLSAVDTEESDVSDHEISVDNSSQINKMLNSLSEYSGSSSEMHIPDEVSGSSSESIKVSIKDDEKPVVIPGSSEDLNEKDETSPTLQAVTNEMIVTEDASSNETHMDEGKLDTESNSPNKMEITITSSNATSDTSPTGEVHSTDETYRTESPVDSSEPDKPPSNESQPTSVGEALDTQAMEVFESTDEIDVNPGGTSDVNMDDDMKEKDDH